MYLFRCLLEKSKHIGLIYLEDVYISGLCAEACNISRIHQPGFEARQGAELKPLQTSSVVTHYADHENMRRLHLDFKRMATD